MPRRRRLALWLVLAVGAPLAFLGGPASAVTVAVKPYDFDGDGRPDLVVGAGLQVGSVIDAGGVVVVPASRTGLSRDEQQVITQSTPGVPGGSEEGDELGSAVASADFDGDGYADLAIGAPAEGIGAADDQGAVTVIYGSATGLDPRRSSSLTSASGLLYGEALVAGDFVGDGHVDLAVGSPAEDRVVTDGYAYPGGVVHILPGSSTGVTTIGEVTVRRQGSATTGDVGFGEVLAAGDVNGDRKSDLVVGSSGRVFDEAGYPGSISVCLGAPAGPDGCTRLLHTDHLAGLRALAVGNVSGSATPEIVAGSVYQPVDTGRVTILQLEDGNVRALAKTTEITQASAGVPGSAEVADKFGSSLVLGDIERDGHDDMVIGAPGENDFRGRVTVVRGSSGVYATSGNYSVDQGTKGVPGKAERGDSFGASETLLDHDGDGRLDLSVGASGENDAEGAITSFEGSGRKLTSKGSHTFGLDAPGFRHPRETFFGDVLGLPSHS